MSFWSYEKDTDETLFDNLGDYVPQSISNECKRELRKRGYSEDKIKEEEWKRMK